MHIILVSNRLATTRTISITPSIIAAATALVFAAAFIIGCLIAWVSAQYQITLFERPEVAAEKNEAIREDAYLRSNLNAMATKIGEMQAKLLRLDSISERVASLAGIKSAEMPRSEKDEKRDKNERSQRAEPGDKNGKGGPLILAQPRTTAEVEHTLSQLGQRLDSQLDSLSVLETILLDNHVQRALLPTIKPIRSIHSGSGFGWRVDPFVGVGAMHEGIDFSAEVGTPVFSAAGGVVTRAELHPSYGNLVEIDHGNDFTSRYAHLSKINVEVGQILKRGQTIALSGNTGRSTGPHLHFEVRYQGVAQNPSRFLEQGEQLARHR